MINTTVNDSKEYKKTLMTSWVNNKAENYLLIEFPFSLIS